MLRFGAGTARLCSAVRQQILTLIGVPAVSAPARQAGTGALPGPTAAAAPRAGLPIPWVNLRYGIAADELTASNTAACGTFVLEWGLLSRLTGAAAPPAAAMGVPCRPHGLGIEGPDGRAGLQGGAARRVRGAGSMHPGRRLPGR